MVWEARSNCFQKSGPTIYLPLGAYIHDLGRRWQACRSSIIFWSWGAAPGLGYWPGVQHLAKFWKPPPGKLSMCPAFRNHPYRSKRSAPGIEEAITPPQNAHLGARFSPSSTCPITCSSLPVLELAPPSSPWWVLAPYPAGTVLTDFPSSQHTWDLASVQVPLCKLSPCLAYRKDKVLILVSIVGDKIWILVGRREGITTGICIN